VRRIAIISACAAATVLAGCAKWEWRERALADTASSSSSSASGHAASWTRPGRIPPPEASGDLEVWLRDSVESLEPMDAEIVRDDTGGEFAFLLKGERESSPMELVLRNERGALFLTERGERSPSWSESLVGERMFYVSRRQDLPEEQIHERGPLGFITYMILARPTLAPGETARGVALYCTGMLGLTREEYSMAAALRDDGWALLIVQPPWGVFQSGKALLGGRKVLLDKVDGDPVEAGELLATIADDGFIEWSDAVRAALTHAKEQWSDVPERPRVLVASSLGAIAAPGLARGLREDDESRAFDAVVLIGGGADLMTVARQSGMFRGLRLIKAKGTPWDSWDHSDAADAATEAYVRASRLDPLSAAGELRDTPTLMVQATLDDIVPTATGEKLWRALGQPSRLQLLTGHVLMFTMLPGDRFVPIIEWIDEKTDAVTAPSP
jgi:pimeloyl-ACP methyl ester carboxylesterase